MVAGTPITGESQSSERFPHLFWWLSDVKRGVATEPASMMPFRLDENSMQERLLADESDKVEKLTKVGMPCRTVLNHLEPGVKHGKTEAQDADFRTVDNMRS